MHGLIERLLTLPERELNAAYHRGAGRLQESIREDFIEETDFWLSALQGLSPEQLTSENLVVSADAPQSAQDFSKSLKELVHHPKLDYDGKFHVAKSVTSDEVTDIFSHTASICNAGENIRSISKWVLGNIACELEDHDVDISFITTATDYSMAEIETAKRVFRFFDGHKMQLSWTHHKELAYRKGLHDTTKKRIGALASERGWSVASMRTVLRYVKDKRGDKLVDTLALIPLADDALSAPAKSPTTQYIHVADSRHITISTSPPTGDGFIAKISRILRNPEPEPGREEPPKEALEKAAGTTSPA